MVSIHQCSYFQPIPSHHLAGCLDSSIPCSDFVRHIVYILCCIFLYANLPKQTWVHSEGSQMLKIPILSVNYELGVLSGINDLEVKLSYRVL